jgi:ABC-2 type transport system permease protein
MADNTNTESTDELNVGALLAAPHLSITAPEPNAASPSFPTQSGNAPSLLPAPELNRVQQAAPLHRRSALQTARRMLQLWRLYAKMDVLWIARDLKMFIFWSLVESLLSVGAVMGMLLLAERFSGIGVWTKMQVVFLLGYTATSSGLVDTFFNFNVAFISRRIGRGQMDHVLVQPQPLWLTLMTEGFCPLSGAVTMLPGIALLAWALPRLSMSVSPAWALAFLLNLAASTTVSMAFQFIWGSLAFWEPRAAEEVSSTTARLLRLLKPYPLEGLGAGLTGSLLTLLPVGFLGWYPCRALLGIESHAWSMAVTPIVAVLFTALAAAIFRKGLQHYGRTGSQRYLRHGHRC